MSHSSKIAFQTPTGSMESSTSTHLEEAAAGAQAEAPASPSGLLCSSPMRNEAPPEEEPNESYSFMTCLSPSSTLPEPYITTTTKRQQLPYDAKVPSIDEEGESPKCASYNLPDFTGSQNEMFSETENNSTSDNSQENHAIVDASSVGLMASGLAWVRRQQSNIYEATSLSSSQSSQYPMDQRGLNDNPTSYRASLKDSAAPYTPTRPTAVAADRALQVKSCPTTPSYMLSQAAAASPLGVTWGKVPLGSNNTINNTSRSVASSPMKAELTPRMNPVNNIYSISSLLTGIKQPAEESQNSFRLERKQVQESQNSFLLGSCTTVEDDQEEDEEAAAITSLGYFCQDDTPNRSNGCSSPSRSALARVFSRIGSDYTDDGEFSTFEEDDDDSLLDDDENVDDIHGVAWIPPVRCVAETPSLRVNSCILSPLQMHQVARHVLPKGIAACQWKRIYSLARDGDSFDVCLHYARNDSKTLLVVRTTRGAIFGGYAGEAWVRNGEAHYYGNNESCLFTFEEGKKTNEAADILETPAEKPMPQEDNQAQLSSAATCPDDRASPVSFIGAQVDKPLDLPGTFTPTRPQTANHSAPGSAISKSLVDDDDDEDEEETYEETLPPLRVYKYKGVNRYIQYCDGSRKMLAFGGGGAEGSFGLCVEREFQLGSTGHCDTFDNEPLCEQENFKIVDVELWGFLTGQF